MPAPPRITLILPTLAFIALAWLNCHAIESWESESPRSGQGSIHYLALTLAIIAASMAAFALHQPKIRALLFAASVCAVLLAILDRYRPQNPTTLRAAADLALLTPLLLLFFP